MRPPGGRGYSPARDPCPADRACRATSDGCRAAASNPGSHSPSLRWPMQIRVPAKLWVAERRRRWIAVNSTLGRAARRACGVKRGGGGKLPFRPRRQGECGVLGNCLVVQLRRRLAVVASASPWSRRPRRWSRRPRHGRADLAGGRAGLAGGRAGLPGGRAGLARGRAGLAGGRARLPCACTRQSRGRMTPRLGQARARARFGAACGVIRVRRGRPAASARSTWWHGRPACPRACGREPRRKRPAARRAATAPQPRGCRRRPSPLRGSSP